MPLLAGDRLNVRAVALIPLRQALKKGGWPRRTHYEKHPEQLDVSVSQPTGEPSDWGVTIIEAVLNQQRKAAP